MQISDLHIHLLGAIPANTHIRLIENFKSKSQEYLDLTPAQIAFISNNSYGSNLIKSIIQNNDPSQISNIFRSFTNLKEFLISYLITASLITDVTTFEILAVSVINELAKSKLNLVEITFSPSLYTDRGINLEDLLCVLATAKNAQKSDFKIGYIVDPIRNRGSEHATDTLKKISAIAPDLLCGVGLAGDEFSNSLADFKEYFYFAKDLGLGTTVHAGENLNPETLTDVFSLPIDRIGHGVAAAGSKTILNKIIKQNITLEVCPTSNIRCGLFSNLKQHPIRYLYDQGVKITVNSDDPFFFETTVNLEFSNLLDEKIFTPLELEQIKLQGMKSSFLAT